ncbi:MAG: DUF167 domain-containing protein [Promethearchaeota archaeon]|jgi:uncharacterized protein YggU (UPF0235/DUF167 family)
MSFYEKVSNYKYLLNVKLKPNSKKVRIIESDDFLIIQVRSKAIQNKANIELINLLKKKLKIPSSEIKILSGLKSPNKIVQIKFKEEIEGQLFIEILLN